MEFSVIGGVYREVCNWPEQESLLGSGGRAAECLANLDSTNRIVLYAEASQRDQETLSKHFAFKNNVFLNISEREITPEFVYSHPLASPEIFPFPGSPSAFGPEAQTELENALIFGMIDRYFSGRVKNVVYDPQNSYSPILFSETQCKSENLIYVLNQNELTVLFTKKNDSDGISSLDDMVDWLMQHEKANLIVVKCGCTGAYVKEAGGSSNWIPPFKNKGIKPIGSGDCFAAAFTHFYFSAQLSAEQSAKYASLAAAFYVEHSTLVAEKELENLAPTYQPLSINSDKVTKVYLAGPFFSMPQMWLINETRKLISSFGMEVHSPYHVDGIGPAEVVAPKDTQAIEDCDILYAIMDGHDPGTLFEIGYAIKAGKKVVIYTEHSSEEELKMYEGTGCIVERDYATSIYVLRWSCE